MLRYLLASTAVLAIAAPASAETISTKVTTPLKTSTVKAGQPDSITVATAGSVVLTSGTAITMDDDHSVTVQGDLTVTGASSSAGIVAVAGTTGDISNSGKITIDEAYTATDSDNDGDLDGPFAVGSDRYGIRTDGAHTGKVVNSGTITVEGNDSLRHPARRAARRRAQARRQDDRVGRPQRRPAGGRSLGQRAPRRPGSGHRQGRRRSPVHRRYRRGDGGPGRHRLDGLPLDHRALEHQQARLRRPLAGRLGAW